MPDMKVTFVSQDFIASLHPGLIHCPLSEARQIMPSLIDIFDTAPLDHFNYTVDVKVHMLMPGMFPCIPDWHQDMVPRDENKVKQPDLIDISKKMYLWVSGVPLTEFKDGRTVNPCEWIEFTQEDWHRCIASDCHTWRLFIRMVPFDLLPPREGDYVRKHSQVYLNANNYEW